jgi:hypothetical protein
MIPEIHRWRSVILIPPTTAAPFERQRFRRRLPGVRIVEFAFELKITDFNNDRCGHKFVSPFCSVSKIRYYPALNVKIAVVDQISLAPEISSCKIHPNKILRRSEGDADVFQIIQTSFN